mgnify:CR=1 FL=1
MFFCSSGQSGPKKVPKNHFYYCYGFYCRLHPKIAYDFSGLRGAVPRAEATQSWDLTSLVGASVPMTQSRDVRVGVGLSSLRSLIPFANRRASCPCWRNCGFELEESNQSMLSIVWDEFSCRYSYSMSNPYVLWPVHMVFNYVQNPACKL